MDYSRARHSGWAPTFSAWRNRVVHQAPLAPQALSTPRAALELGGIIVAMPQQAGPNICPIAGSCPRPIVHSRGPYALGSPSWHRRPPARIPSRSPAAHLFTLSAAPPSPVLVDWNAPQTRCRQPHRRGLTREREGAPFPLPTRPISRWFPLRLTTPLEGLPLACVHRLR